MLLLQCTKRLGEERTPLPILQLLRLLLLMPVTWRPPRLLKRGRLLLLMPVLGFRFRF